MKKVNSCAARYLAGLHLRYFLSLVALLILLSGFSLAQSGEVTTKLEINCRLPESGEFIEIPDVKWEAPKGVYRTGWRITSAKTEKDDEWWTPTGVDIVVPIYKLFLYRKKPDGMPEGKCANVAKIEGLVINPLGKVFRFEQAAFDRRTLLLKFTTVRRDKLRYQGEFQFFAEPEQIRGGIFQAGNMSLKADSPDLGVVSFTFPVKASRDE